MNDPTLPCAVAGCGRLSWHGRSRYCSRHMEKRALYGSPTVRSLTVAEARLHRKFVAEVFARHQGSKVIAVGLQLAQELLDYVPRAPGVKYDRQAADLMRSLRDRGTTALEVLTVVCEVMALEYVEPAHITDPLVTTYALGRRVSLIRRWPRGWRPTGRLTRHLGELLRESLGLVALRVIREGERLADLQRERRETVMGEW